MTYNQILINNVRQLIKNSGIKQKVIAERIGLTPQMFSDMLNGRKVITVEHIPRIAAALGVGVDELYVIETKEVS